MLKSELPAPLARGGPGRREFFFPSPEVTVTFSRDREPLPRRVAKRGGFGERDGALLWRSAAAIDVSPFLVPSRLPVRLPALGTGLGGGHF